MNRIARFISLLTMQSYFDILSGISIIAFYSQEGIDSLKQWSDHWLLKLNIISKCKVVSFGRHVDKNYVYNKTKTIRLLEYEESYKFA